MIIALFYIFRKISIISLITGRPWSTAKTSSSGLQNAVTSTTPLDVGDPKNILNVNGGISGERLSAIESLPESNYVTSVHLIQNTV